MTGSTLPRRALGRLLRSLRENADKSQLAASRIIEISPQGVSRLEEGHLIKISTLQLNGLVDFYGAGDAREQVLSLWDEVKATKKTEGTGGWWRAYADTYGTHFDHYLSLEEAAQWLATFHLTLLPGLLQTAGYRRALIRAAHPGMPPVEVERRIELMTRRQTRLRVDDTFAMKVLLSEVALRLPVGDSGVMAEQLHRLADVAQLPNVSIQVVPLSAPAQAGYATGSFTLCMFPPLKTNRLTEPPVVYVEGHEGGLFLEEPSAVTRYRTTLDELGRVALSQDESRAMILDVAESMR